MGVAHRLWYVMYGNTLIILIKGIIEVNTSKISGHCLTGTFSAKIMRLQWETRFGLYLNLLISQIINLLGNLTCWEIFKVPFFSSHLNQPVFFFFPTGGEIFPHGFSIFLIFSDFPLRNFQNFRFFRFFSPPEKSKK